MLLLSYMLSYKKAEDLEFTRGGRDMQAFFTGLLAAAVPILLSLGRIVMAVLAIFLHRENLKRLLKGQERKTDFFRKKGTEQ